MSDAIKNSTPKIPLKTGRVFLVGAGPGDPELITLKAVRLIREADVILYDRLINPELLDFSRADSRRISVGKQAGKPSVSQHDINKLLVEHALDGKTVVRLKGGDPFVFGRGGEECLALVKCGIRFEVVPGITSAFSVPAYAGIPVTQRNEATGVTVISGHLHPDSEPYDWAGLSSTATLVILMGLRNIRRITQKLIEHGRAKDTPAAVIRRGTTRDQEIVTGTLANIADKSSGFQSPATIVIGDVVNFHTELNWFQPTDQTNNHSHQEPYSAVI